MIASSACEYDGSVPRKRPRSPVSAVANSLATSGSLKPSHVASSGILLEHVVGHVPADAADRAELADLDDRAVVEVLLLVLAEARRPELEHRVDARRSTSPANIVFSSIDVSSTGVAEVRPR